jgi:hypothetical protein
VKNRVVQKKKKRRRRRRRYIRGQIEKSLPLFFSATIIYILTN